MKQTLRKVFHPLLNIFESDSGEYNYKPSHRKILLFMSIIFSSLTVAILFLNRGGDVGYLFPAIVFGLIGFTGLVVGLLGTDRAVAKIWGTR